MAAEHQRGAERNEIIGHMDDEKALQKAAVSTKPPLNESRAAIAAGPLNVFIVRRG